MSTTLQPGKTFGLHDRFFPVPIASSNAVSPRLFPGISAESRHTLVDLLRKNNDKWHIFTNDKGFHNHIAHHLFAAYAFGASPDVLNSTYQLHSPYQKPAFTSPGIINASNWKLHLGDHAYYNAYMHFFASEIDSIGAERTLEKYIFSKEGNLSEDGDLGPQMLCRFLSGVLHPMIHVGHWAEFGVPGMLAEGIAQAAMNVPQTPELMPPDFFYSGNSQVCPLSMGVSLPSQQSNQEESFHAFTILARMLADENLAPGAVCHQDEENKYTVTLRKVGHIIREHACRWQISSPNDIPQRLEEVSWLAVLVYGLGGWRKSHAFRSDFHFVHLVTSSVFLGPIISGLPFYAQGEMLRAYFVIILGWWVSTGRPAIDIAAYYSSDFDPWTLVPSVLRVRPNESALAADEKGTQANIWLPIIQSSLLHPEEHLIKAQRALAHFDAVYGSIPRGCFEGKTELHGAEILDGSLFSKVALHTQKALGWVREGESPGKFDRAGLGWDVLWTGEL